jgi:hypothetical protein
MSRFATARDLLASRFPEALPAAQRSWSAVPTGIAALDRILPSGGFQRGRLSTWTPAIGSAALLRAACLHTVAGGERTAWIDAGHAVAGACWRPAPVLVRPPNPLAALRATEELARSGGFALIVLDGAEPETTELVRLSRAAREGSSALVLLSPVTALATLRLAIRPLLGGYTWRRSRTGDADDIRTVQVQVEARASGWFAHETISLSLWRDDLRLSVETGRPDRRGERHR